MATPRTATDLFHKLREARFFLEEMRHVEKLLQERPQVEVPTSPERFRLIQAFHYYFAAMLSSSKSVHLYLSPHSSDERVKLLHVRGDFAILSK